MNKSSIDAALLFLDSSLALQLHRMELPGLSVAISHKGKLVFSKAYGYANITRKEKLTTSHVFRVASQSKTFTATAIMQLDEQGMLCLNDPVVAHLPWLAQHRDVRFARVTVEQLLSHGSGMIRNGQDADYWLLKKPFPDEAALKHAVLESDLVFDNNVKVKYSNLAYGLLGMVIEAVSGKAYAEYVGQSIIEPLGLSSTAPEYSSKIAKRLATGYSRNDFGQGRKPLAVDGNTRAYASATGFYSTPEDLCRYFSAHMVGSKKMLCDESKKEMQRVHWKKENAGGEEREMGLGLMIEHEGMHRMFGHSGSFPGHLSISMCDPSAQLVICLATNCVDFETVPAVRGIFSVLDYFDAQGAARADRSLKQLEGRYANVWNVIHIVAVPARLVAVYGDTWKPFSTVEELEPIDDLTFKVTTPNGMSAEGELVKFRVDKRGRVESLKYCGQTMLPYK